MKIVNPQLQSDLAEGRPVRLELGAGARPRKGYYAVDHVELDHVDMVADLNQPLDLVPDGSVEAIYSRHALEHIREFLPLMREIHRVTQPGGHIEIIVPHFSNVYGYSDPTHVRFFGLYSMYYFASAENQPKIRRVPTFYTDTRFKIQSIRIEFYRKGLIDKLLAPVFTRLFNLNIHFQNFYERRLSFLFHASQIRYVMTPDKGV